MDPKYRLLLQRYQQDIIKDLDVEYILDQLLTSDGILFEEYVHIRENMNDRVERIRYLIDILIKKGTNKSYQAFVDTLAKDYDWLWQKFTTEDGKDDIENSFEDILGRGDVPRLPEFYVPRNSVEREVASKLKALTRHKILALYGMIGSGKTVIAISVLRHNRDIVTSNFNSVVFWLNLSNCKTEDDIVNQQKKLHRKISTMYPTQNSLMNSTMSMSSIGSTVDSLTSYDCTWQEWKDKLKRVFEDPILKEALLVLDEVNKSDCLNAFDVGCKILITTRDTNVLENFGAVKVNIDNHFTESESLELLASCLDINVSSLPRYAKKLHHLCGGSPYDMALLAAEFAENREILVHDPSRWKYYIEKLRNRELFSFSKHSYKQMKTIEVCINSLKPDILPLFKMLAVFPDDVKVPAKVVSKLWNVDIPKVESIMRQLKSKSLITQTYDYEQKKYLYEIHYLIMNYLRTSTSDETMKKLHLDLLKSYNYTNDNDIPVEIQDDGYIAFYVGYHLLHTKDLNNAWRMFSKLFLNLKFIGNKVRLTGIADVNLDLQNYEEKIVKNNNHDRDLLYSLRCYLNRFGYDLHRFPYTDIIQSILQNERPGILYTAAMNVAQERCAKNELYFEFLHEQDSEELNQKVIDVMETVTCVCFLGDLVLVGTSSGLIKFFQIDTNKLIKEITTSESYIKWIGVCPVKLQLVASLAGGVIKLWYIDDISTSHNQVNDNNDDDVIEEEAEEAYNNNYPSNKIITSKNGQFINCRWTNNEEKLIAHTAKTITIYGIDGSIIQELDMIDREILCCVPCNYDKNVIIAFYNSFYSLEMIDLKTNVRQSLSEENDLVLNILTVPGTKRILVLKKREVTEYIYQSPRYRGEKRRSVITSSMVRDNMCFLSMAVNKTGTLLFVSTDDGRIICVDLMTYVYLFDLPNRRGNVVSMAMSEESNRDDFEPGSDVLLTGTGTIENSAKVWFLDASFIKQNADKNGKVPLTKKFDASFINVSSPYTPSSVSSSIPQSTHNTPKRHQSFVNSQEVTKKVVRTTMSLDRHSLKPLNLKGICNGNSDSTTQPLIAVVDKSDNIQVMRGTKLLTQIMTNRDEKVTVLKITPCNHYVIYGLNTGIVRRFTIKTKEIIDIMDTYSPVVYLNFVSSNLMIVAGENQCMMAYSLVGDKWETMMLQKGKANLGSQDLLNGIQGVKIRNRNDNESNSSEESVERVYSYSDVKSLCKGSNLVNSYWIQEIGLVTVESNATVKVWDTNLKVSNVLNGREFETCVEHADMQKNTLVLCHHEYSFQTFKIQKCRDKDGFELKSLKRSRLNSHIVSCALTDDGNILALGLSSGDIVIWNVPKNWQMLLLKHHKSRVQWCGWSPTPTSGPDEPPLVLLSAATELVWWDISYLRTRSGQPRPSLDAVTPMTSPVDARSEDKQADKKANFFFGDSVSLHQCWKLNWRRKTFKEGSRKKEILSCIKLSGLYASHVCHDDKFACFVTVDDTGQAHIMSVMDS
ncbi:uncharacterized protein LOC121733566 [Aricia agestis]|uniref:uncharacterized protein LOC121733566 n=1 Tax=Aricia agestis TaxID=91739 RepID=UPI001C20B176|nr:uncharacterized protein LOC121733566 [Aricia agestis]